VAWNYSFEASVAENQAIGRLCDMTGHQSPFEAVRARSRMLLAAFGNLTPPFDPEEMAGLQGIGSVDRSDITFDACLLPTPDGFRVEVCKYHGRGRQNFSIAHEIGHTFFIELEPSLGAARREVTIPTVSSANSPLIERLCDAAAAELIWPTHIFERDAWKAGPSLEAVLYLASRYRGSVTATGRRFAEIGPWRCAFIIWGADDGAGSARKLFPRSIYRSSCASLPSRDRIVAGDGSQVYRAINCEHIVKGRETLGPDERSHYVESIKIGQDVISMVVLEPYAEIVAAKRPTPAQALLFK
jgi:hypothetical protein